MNKNFWKRFLTWNPHHNDGFTLVELIVVIAILAILAAVAVPAYSGYITKANKQNDISLISEVKQALELYAYSNPDVKGGYVILGQEGDTFQVSQTDDAGVGNAAMIAVFGENWKTSTPLKWPDWKGESAALSYSETNYFGKEKALLGEVDRLTGALSGAIENNYNLIGDTFSDFLGKNHYNSTDPTTVGNAAVLYVAQQTNGKKDDIQNAFKSHVNGTSTDLQAVWTELAQEKGMGDAAALAAIYAYAEGFAQYCDKVNPANNAVKTFHESANFDAEGMNASEAFNEIMKAFVALNNAGGIENVIAYTNPENGPGLTDLAGYVDIMGTVDSNKGIVSGNLASGECFTDGKVEKLLNGFAAMGDMKIKTADGQVAIAFTVVDGVINTHTLPVDLDQ